ACATESLVQRYPQPTHWESRPMGSLIRRYPQPTHSGSRTSGSAARMKQRLKIEEISTTLAECGFVALDEQAYVLGLSRSTAWTVLRGKHKSSGLSAMTINRMLAACRQWYV